jgi:N-acetylglucosaminyldiphosphoundecaprenol N-acetyl-beta-D-mannosaminyltransferase
MDDLPRVNILGVGINAINMDLAIETIDKWIASNESHYVCVTPVHSVMECQRDPALRRIFNASGLTTPDGMPLVWLCRHKGYRHVGRVYGPDLLLALCAHSQSKGHRHFFYGGGPCVAERLVNNLQTRFPSLAVAGTYSPPFRSLTPEEDDQTVQMINKACPDVLWVGLGAPKQERWMASHMGRLTVPVLIGVGAAFDFHAGCKKQAPHWMQQSGLEWLFRLITEPRRLWRRYLVNNPLFLTRVLLQAVGLCKYSLQQ